MNKFIGYALTKKQQSLIKGGCNCGHHTNDAPKPKNKDKDVIDVETIE